MVKNKTIDFIKNNNIHLECLLNDSILAEILTLLLDNVEYKSFEKNKLIFTINYLSDLEASEIVLAAGIIYCSIDKCFDIESLFSQLHDDKSDRKTSKILKIKKLIDDTFEVDKLLDDLDNEFSNKEKIKSLILSSMPNEQVRFRPYALQISADERAIIVKLIKHLYELKRIKNIRNIECEDLVLKTKYIFIPIAYRLGIWKIKSELEDIIFELQYPEEYNSIRKWSFDSYAKYSSVLKKIADDIENELKENKIFVSKTFFSERHLYGIFERYNGIPSKPNYLCFQSLIIICNTIKDCYKVLGLISSVYESSSKKVSDYIAYPKSNCYQSIHKLISIDQKFLLIKIRTEKMQRVARNGILEISNFDFSDQFSKSLKQKKEQLEWQFNYKKFDEVKFSSRFVRFNKDHIYVFTPKKDLIVLEKNSTVKDFAKCIHMDIAKNLKYAIVNGYKQAMNKKLENGDSIFLVHEEKEFSRSHSFCVESLDKQGLLSTVTQCLSDNGINVTDAVVTTDPVENIARMEFRVDIIDFNQYEVVFRKIPKLPSVINVSPIKDIKFYNANYASKYTTIIHDKPRYAKKSIIDDSNYRNSIELSLLKSIENSPKRIDDLYVFHSDIPNEDINTGLKNLESKGLVIPLNKILFSWKRKQREDKSEYFQISWKGRLKLNPIFT